MSTPARSSRSAVRHPTPNQALIGSIVRVQVQAEPLKRERAGDRGGRWYDPAPIHAVDALRLDAGGVHGGDDTGAMVHDVHHRDHPRSRNRGGNGISLGFTAHYEVMRAAFGAHLADGVAGENLLIASDRTWTAAELAGGVVVETAGGPVRLAQVIVASPCVEFTKFCLGLDAAERSDRRVTDALRLLDGGVRGFYATWHRTGEWAGPAPVLRPGDRVYRLTYEVDPVDARQAR